MLSEQFVDAHVRWVELLHQWVSVLGETGSEYDEFIEFVHSLEELSDEGPHEHVDYANLAVDLDWERDVGIFNWLERRVHQRFI